MTITVSFMFVFFKHFTAFPCQWTHCSLKWRTALPGRQRLCQNTGVCRLHHRFPMLDAQIGEAETTRLSDLVPKERGNMVKLALSQSSTQ